jgi:glycosyltransferase involved in cell wall biosynthesis
LVNKPMSPFTGIGRYVQELERGLKASGCGVRVAPLPALLPDPVSALATFLGYDLAAFLRSYPMRADVVPADLTHLTSQTLGLLALTQRLSRPLIVTVHDILPYLLRDDPRLSAYRNRLHRLTDGLAMRGLRRADHLIADSHYTKSTLVKALGIAPERISVVHLGVDSARYRPGEAPDDFRARYGLPAGQRYLLYVGSEDPRKHVPVLLQALALVRVDHPDVTLLKVGAPGFVGERTRHLTMARELGVGEAVRWFDDVPEDDLPRFYNAAAVVGFPSGYEGFGFPVLEALACGRPVVALRASSVPELAGEEATLVDELDPAAFAVAISRELASPSVSGELRVRHAHTFSWQMTAARTLEVYRHVGVTADAVQRAEDRSLRRTPRLGPRLRAQP